MTSSRAATRGRIGVAVAIVLLALGAATAASAREPGAKVAEFGRYELRDVGQPTEAKRTASGIVRPADGHRLLERSDVIVGQLGNSFGIRVRFENLPPGVAAVTIRTTHPPLTNPKTGKTTTVSEYDWTADPDGGSYFCFSFDEIWEIAEGDWTIHVLYEGKVIAKKTFKIVVPLN